MASIAERAVVAALALSLSFAACTSNPAPSRSTSAGSASASGTDSGSPAPSISPTARRPLHLEISRAGFSLTVAVQREVAVADGPDVLVAGGLDASGTSTDAVDRLAPATSSMGREGTMAGAFHDAAGAIVGGRLVIFGGGPSSGTDIVQALGGGVIGHLPTVASDLEAAIVGHEVVLVGGYDGTSFLTSVLVTRDGTTFHQIATLPVGLRYAAVAAAGPNAVIVAGGLSTAGPVATILRIAVPGGVVTTIGRLPRPLAHEAAVALGGAVFVLGGEDASGQTVRTVERIDPQTGDVRTVHPLPGTVADAAAVAVGPDRALLIGGRRGPQGSDVPLATILSLRLVR
jgi:Kelch motif